MAEIVIDNLRKDFGDFTAVQSSSFRIEDGEFFMLLGPSGCGKTTTLRMIAGLELPSSGKIFIDGEEVGQKPARERDIAFVFQMFALYPHLNVRRNISYPLISQGMARQEVRAKVAEVARILDIEEILDRPVGGLSGGDRQRVALGRAIVRDPKAFMMDEPLGALDAEFRERMAEELRALHDRMGATTVYVTHDQLEAMQMGDKIVVMNHGVIEQFGPPQEIYDTPVTRFVADFIGSPSMNFLNFHQDLAPGDDTVLVAGIPLPMPRLIEGHGGEADYGVRPEHVRLSDAAPYRGRILASEYLGTTQIVTVESPAGEVKARIPSHQPARPGERVGLEFDGARVTLFAGEDERALRSDLNDGVLRHG
ncbi:MAG: ABC transporter ATP-binding protein [Marinibacterium sp.]